MIETTEAYGFSFAYPAGDSAVGACLRDYGEFSRMGVTLSIEGSRGQTFVDVGANIGAFALPVSRTAGSVIAIEGHPSLADLLRQNVEANARTNISVVAAAAGARTGLVDFPAPSLDGQGNFGSIGIRRTTGPTVEVDMVRLDDISPESTSMVKIDVEGFELEVLKGAKYLLNHVKPSWLVEYSTPDLLLLFAELDYRMYWFYDAFVTPKAPKKRWTGKFLGDLSLLAVPPQARQPLGMVEARAGDPAPKYTAGFEYLRLFGITPIGCEQAG